MGICGQNIDGIGVGEAADRLLCFRCDRAVEGDRSVIVKDKAGELELSVAGNINFHLQPPLLRQQLFDYE